MGCSASRPVAPVPGIYSDGSANAAPSPPTPSLLDSGTGKPRPAIIINDGSSVSSSTTKEKIGKAFEVTVNVAEFVDEAGSILDAVAAAPEAISNFSQALEDNASGLYEAISSIFGAVVTVASVSAARHNH